MTKTWAWYVLFIFDIFHLRWPWSTKTSGRNSTSTALRWSSPSLAGESTLFSILQLEPRKSDLSPTTHATTAIHAQIKIMQLIQLVQLFQLMSCSFFISTRPKSVVAYTRPLSLSVLVEICYPRPYQHKNDASSFHHLSLSFEFHLHPHSQRSSLGHHHYPQWSCIGVWANKTSHQNRIIFAGIYINAGKKVNQARSITGCQINVRGPYVGQGRPHSLLNCS